MKKILVSMLFGIFFMTSTALAINLEFTLDVSDKIVYPNETIPINVSMINKEISFSARNATVGIYIGKRSFFYELGDIKASDTILKENAIVKIEKIVKEFYPRLEIYFKSRAFIVHNTYSIDFIEKSRKYNISCFAFTLSKDNFELEKKKGGQFFIEASEKEVLTTIQIIKELTESVLEIISDLNNIDSIKFITKFKQITKEGKDCLKITF